jgi:sterol 3beta-glucosyltransferase
MKLTCIAMGSRGDVQPYIALGAGLQAAGHQVRLATHAEFQPLVEAYGLEFHDMGSDPRQLLESEMSHAMLASGKNVFRFLRLFGKVVEPILKETVIQSRAALQDADGVIQGNIGLVAYRLAQPEVPYCVVCLQPFMPTNAYPSAFFPQLPLGRLGYNRLSHHLFDAVFWQFMAKPLAKVHRKMGFHLPNAQERRVLRQRQMVCYAYSPSLLPPPPDLPANHHVTGYLFLDSRPDWQPPQELADFLAAGPPPVYIGFGSMRNRQPEETAELAIAALQRTGQRGILMRGWGGMKQAEVPESILLIDAVPHDWLLPRMRAVVHHGGAGTTAAGLRAGVPSIVIPYFADQPFWARTVYQAGVGPRPIPRKRLSVELLAEAINTAVTDTGLRERAAQLGERIRTENGVQEAVRVIEEYFERNRSAFKE